MNNERIATLKFYLDPFFERHILPWNQTSHLLDSTPQLNYIYIPVIEQLLLVKKKKCVIRNLLTNPLTKQMLGHITPYRM